MFSSLRQGSTLYVLYKDDLKLKVGTVTSMTQPTFNQYLPNMPMQPIDAVVKFDDETSNEFKQLQPSLSVATYGNVVVAETKELMTQEVEQMARVSKSQIDNMPYHQRVLEETKRMLAMLNPAYAKEQQTEKELQFLKQEMAELKDLMRGMTTSSISPK